MNIIDFLQNLARIFYVLVSVITIADYLRHRDRIRRDIMLAFASLTASTVIGQAIALLTLQSALANQLAGLALLAQPYLVLRLVRNFQPLPGALEHFALAGLLAAWGLTLATGIPLSPPIALLILAYFAVINGYAINSYRQAYAAVKDPARRQLHQSALNSTILTVILLIGGMGAFFPAQAQALVPQIQALAPLLNKIGGMAVITQPFFLLRLVRFFRPLPPVVERGALAGMVIAWLIFLLGGTPLSGAGTLVIVAYFVAINGYTVYAFIQGAFASVGVTRQRLTFAAAGSVLLALLFLVAGIRILFPAVTRDTAPLIQGMSVLAGLSFYLGFASPRWLRQSWQLVELRNYLIQSTPRTNKNAPADILNRLRLAVARAMGTDKVVIALWNTDSEKLVLDENTLLPDSKVKHDDFNLNATGVVKAAWANGEPVVAYRADGMNAPDIRLMQIMDAEALFLIPITTRDRTLALLMVFLEHGSLFVEDDLSLLSIFAQHTATLLENEAVLEQLRRYTEDLERKVLQRTAALQRSNEELGRFAYVASHDLREPLRTVTSYLQLLKERYGSRLDSDADEFISFAVEGSLRMKDLIDGLLAYSRVETQRQNFAMIDMQKVLEEVHRLLKVAIDESGTTITSDPLPQIQGDERLIIQLFQNLISNAIKYQNGQKPEIHIGAVQKEGEWVFGVRDNGIGIEKPYLERIFVIFQRLHNRSKYPGAGIGLAICRKVVEHHGGRIWAESEKGSGTTFYFTLPSVERQLELQKQLDDRTLEDFGTSTGY